MSDNLLNNSLPAKLDRELVRRTDNELMQLGDGTRDKIEVELNIDTSIDLKQLFPLSKLYALRNLIHWVIALGATLVVYAILVTSTDLLPDGSLIRKHKFFLLCFASGIVVVKFLYAYAYGKTLKYRIDGFRLNVSRGVIWPEIGSIPLVPFHETYVWQTPADFVMGVYSFQHMLGMDPSGSFLRIHGFTKESAYSFQAFLAHLLSKQVYIPQNEMRARMIIN